jgi:DNA-binding CsgD family transcriptional regulator/predicted negative regulator of RcsB-dependent stress response
MVQAAPLRRRRRPRGQQGSGRGVGSGLLEREGELEQLDAALGAAQEGIGQLVVLEGAAGLGKSRLLRWAVEQAGQRSLLALAARSGEPERDFSFGVALQLFERWLSAADAQTREDILAGAAALSLPLFEGQHWGRVQDPGDQAIHGLMHGLFWLTVNISARQPMLLAIDDLHWSDRSSLRFLLYLAERLEDLPVALVVTLRDESSDDGLTNELAHHRMARRLVLSALSERGVAALLAEALDQEPGPAFARTCFETTGGNPFLVHAMIKALYEDGISPDDENQRLISELTPEAVRRHALGRISRLGADALALASVVAVLGDGALLSHAAVLGELDPEASAEAADALESAGLLTITASGLSFTHPLLRAAVYEEIPPAQRARTHLRAARLMRQEHRPDDMVAAQLLLSTRAGEPWAVEALQRAAGRAMDRGNPEAAIRYLTRTLNEPMGRTERARTLLALSRAEATVGEPGAEERLREALTLIDDPREQARAHQMLGTILYTRGNTAAAARSFERGLKVLGSRDDPLARDLHAGYFSAASLVPELAPRAAEHVLGLLERPAGSETHAERAALAGVAAYRATSGAPREEAISLARRAWAGGQLLAEEGPDGWAWSLVTGALAWTDEFEDALQICQVVIDEARRRGSLMAYATASFCSLGAAYPRGLLIQARAHGQAALDARQHGWQVYPYAAVGWQAQVLIEQGELEAAERELDITVLPDHGNVLGHAWLSCVRARVHLLRGRAREALPEVLAAGEMFDRMGFANTYVAPWRPMAALAAHRLGQTERAHDWLDRELEIARRGGAPSHIATVLRTRAQVEGGTAAVELLRGALTALDGSQAGLELLRCTADLGIALRRTGQRAEARELLTQAADLAHRSGARLIEGQVHEELRVAGARPRRLSFSGPDSLTASERRVVDLAIEGLSNRDIAQALFVTPRTVERHLYTSYKKLGVSSRAELGDALAEDERG